MAEVTGIPRWLELQAEIDYRIFLLNEMRRELAAEDRRLTPFERMIDAATGLDEARLAEANGRLAEAKEIIASEMPPDLAAKLAVNPRYQEALTDAESETFDGPGVDAREMIDAATERRRAFRASLRGDVGKVTGDE